MENIFSGGVSSVEVGISNGVAHHTAPASQTSATKNNHRKSLDKGERDKCVEAENKSSLSEKAVKYSHTNGSIHTELEFIERVGYVKYVSLLMLFRFVHCALSKTGNIGGRFVDFMSLMEMCIG